MPEKAFRELKHASKKFNNLRKSKTHGIGYYITITIAAIALVILVGRVGFALYETTFDTNAAVVEGQSVEGNVNPSLAPAEAIDREILGEEHGTGDYYELFDLPERSYMDVPVGAIQYCPLDDLERAQCAVGEITYENYKDAKKTPREQNIATPKGWPQNFETHISALDLLESKDYSGYFYNRSHMIADSLGGSPEAVNIVTGTRTQNVGSTRIKGQYAGGMASAELLARDYLNSSDAIDCPLYYAVTPRYSDDEMLPRTVDVEVENCDKTISNYYIVYNTAQGWDIDYLTGVAERN